MGNGEAVCWRAGSTFEALKPVASRCGPNVDQLRQDFGVVAACKCGTHKALDFLTLRFGTRRSVVQIHSPRPLLNFCLSLVYNNFSAETSLKLRGPVVDQLG